MSSAVQVRFTQTPAPAQYKGNSQCYLTDAGMHIVLMEQEELLLRSIQKAGRKLDQLGITAIEPAGDGWTRDRQWALSQGFTDTKNTNTVVFQGESKAELEQINEVVRWSRELINLPSSEIYPESLCERVIEKLQQAAPNHIQARVVAGDQLLAEERFGIHTVGRASKRAPALLELDFNPTGDANAAVDFALIGKGIYFRYRWLQYQEQRRHGRNEMRYGRSCNCRRRFIARYSARFE